MKLKKLRILSEKNITLYSARISAETTHNRGFNGRCANIFCGAAEEHPDLSLGLNVACPPDAPLNGFLNIVCAQIDV